MPAIELKLLMQKVATGASLTEDEIADAFETMMSGVASPVQMAAFLMALRVRGETIPEITGASRLMRARMLPVEAPPDAHTWYALVVTGVFAGALGYLVATWVQSRTTAARAALVFTLEAPFAALFGVLLLSESLGWAGWLGCAVMLTGIVLAEPAAASALRRLVPARP